LPITVPEYQLQTGIITPGNIIKVKGQLRSYNKYTQTKTRLILTVFARGVVPALPEDMENPNEIFINGFICKAPVYRRTPFGREITDLIVAVNRAFNRSDYIPAIAWGKNAVYSEGLEVGSNVMLWGRLQSRNYNKKISENETEVRTAYELSVTKIEKLDSASVEFTNTTMVNL
jgi:primosomal replication protein N